jgi:hypothetical protein
VGVAALDPRCVSHVLGPRSSRARDLRLSGLTRGTDAVVDIHVAAIGGVGRLRFNGSVYQKQTR